MNRLKEPSTHAGFAAVLLALSAVVPPQWQGVTQAVAAVFGSLAAALPEKGAAK
jgi:hypothetical protein